MTLFSSFRSCFRKLYCK